MLNYLKTMRFYSVVRTDGSIDGNVEAASVEQLCPEGEDLSMDRVAALLLDAFEEVFDVDMVHGEE